MKYILEVNVDDKGYGGVFSFVRNVVRYIDTSRFTISICAFEPFEKEEHKRFISDYGGQVFDCSAHGFFITKQIKTCYKFYHLLKAHRFDVLHIHSDVSYKLLLYGVVARLAGKSDIVVHSHSTGVEGRYIHLKHCLQFIAKRILSLTNFYKVACSRLAAEWMYTTKQAKQALIIKNGINLEAFRYDRIKSQHIRQELSIGKQPIIGTVARFSYQKYPEKLLEVFRVLHKQNPDVILLWIGMGPLRDKIIKKANKYNLNQNILFYGNSDRVQDLYQAMDTFVLTSRFEGLCIAAIEAQAAGIPCLCSAEMSPETKLTDDYCSLSINEKDETWAEKIKQLMSYPRRDTYLDLKRRGYDLEDSVKRVEEIYDGKR